MADTIQKYKDYVMTGLLKSVAPIVIDRASGATATEVNGHGYLDRALAIFEALQFAAQPAHATA
jgi:4-aminobutyrate aminotransferase-like enzyme